MGEFTTRQRKAIKAAPPDPSSSPAAISIPALCLRTSWQQLFVFLTFPKGGETSGAAALGGFATGKRTGFLLSADTAAA